VGLTTPPCKKLIVTQPHIEKNRTVSRRRQWLGERTREHYIATWNVRSLYQPGASKKLEEELIKYRIDIATVQEIRWKLTEMVSLKEYILVDSGSKKNDYGTDFMVRKRKPNIMGYKLINERICVLRIRGRFFNTK
jgi:exonuclease III